jgi:competence protein ComEA
MFKKFVAALAVLLAATAFAAVDANKGTQAELEAVKGIGPAISANIIDERKKSEFKDWTDLVTRVKGVGDRSAANFSAAGLTVNGKGYPGAPVAATTTSPAKAPAKAASSSTNVVTATASKAASAVKSGAGSVASGAKGAGHVVAEDTREQKKAFNDNLAESKAKSADKKAAKAEAKTEKAAAASAAAKASAPAKK